MSYYVFASEDDADAENQTISDDIGCPLPSFNAATGLEDDSAQQTIQWAIPALTNANAQTYPASWVFPAPDFQVSSGGGKGHGGNIDNGGGGTEADYDPTWFASSSP